MQVRWFPSKTLCFAFAPHESPNLAFGATLLLLVLRLGGCPAVRFDCKNTLNSNLLGSFFLKGFYSWKFSTFHKFEGSSTAS